MRLISGSDPSRTRIAAPRRSNGSSCRISRWFPMCLELEEATLDDGLLILHRQPSVGGYDEPMATNYPGLRERTTLRAWPRDARVVQARCRPQESRGTPRLALPRKLTETVTRPTAIDSVAHARRTRNERKRIWGRPRQALRWKRTKQSPPPGASRWIAGTPHIQIPYQEHSSHGAFGAGTTP